MLKHFILLCASFLYIITSEASTFEIKELDSGVYVHNGLHEDISEDYHGDICNLSFIVGNKGIAVIDTGGSYHTGARFLEAIRQVSTLPILYVINTHVHPDHIFGNKAFTKENPIFVGHYLLPDSMELRKESYLRSNKEWLGDDFNGSEIVKPGLTVKTTLELDLGDRTLTLTAYPTAHSNTDLTVVDSKTNTLFTGDLLFVDRTPSIDGDIKGWISVIDEMSNGTFKQVVPGHGPTQTNYQQAIKNEKNYLTTLLKDIRASIKKGETMESTMDTAAESEKGKWLLFEIVNRRNVNNIYHSLEWE